MDNKKDNTYYIKRIIVNLDFILEHTQGLSLSEFERNEILIDSVLFRLIQISKKFR